jgi:coenzyme F420-0:L-glutamate ligase/coenzyme F420-1:gamma-L-glutamate ligase
MLTPALTLTPLVGIPLIQPGDDLAETILSALQQEGIQLTENDILVLAQKIVSKAEGRLVNLSNVEPSKRAKHFSAQTEKDPRLVELILSESRAVIRTRPGLMIVEHRLGFICANAGIDHSNVCSPLTANVGDDVEQEPEEWVLLLPENPDATAEDLRQKLAAAVGVSLGILIIDSHGRAWRNGTVGVTIGLAGLPGVVDKVGDPDLFGYKLRATEIGAADELAAAASLMMGQADEGTPIILVRGFPYRLREAELSELLRPKELDLFR